MKILHIMDDDKFTSSYISFINKNFDEINHQFYIFSEVFYKEIIFEKNIKVLKIIEENKIIKKIKYIKAFLEIFRPLIKYDKIILHNLFNPLIIIFLFLNPWFLKKCNWVVWGADLYCYRNRDKKNFKSNIYYKIEEYVKKNIGEISVLTPGEYEIAQKFYKVKGKQKRAIYMNPVKVEYLDQLSNEAKEKGHLNIQIGNSADSENNHFEILENLLKYKNENIKIYAPLSYGNQGHAKAVKEYGEKLFGDKFIGMLDFMKPEEYSKYLSDIDILIFNHKRQQGLGNIFALGYLEKKIYIRNDITSWNYLKNDLKLKISNFKDIKNQNFQELKENNSTGNKEKLLKTVYSEEYMKNIWKENFES